MELLAPAGNTECLKAAVLNGADAVYFAGKNFGARSFADNFTAEEIKSAVQYCRLRGVKSYITVNTLMLDKETDELDEYIELLANSGADGVIVQDLGVMERFRRICPDMELHASTQMTVHNLSGVRALEKMGVSRVVLARELSAENIRYIAENTDTELEVFVHGAMCMSYSGQCLMSSALGGRSGNRGMCAQPCRLKYSAIKDGRKKTYLSLKDMCLIDYIEELKKMKVASLKIEGRMKGADYVAEVVKSYRRCMDRGGKATADERLALERIFYRGGLTDGYFADKKGTEMFAFDKPDNPYEKAESNKLAEKSEERYTVLECEAFFTEDERPRIVLRGAETEAEYTAEGVLEHAEKVAADTEKIKTALLKTGGTAFRFYPVYVHTDGNPFVPVSVINEMRRKALEMFERKITEKAVKKIMPHRFDLSRESINAKKKLAYAASVVTMEQYEAVKKYPFDFIDVPPELILAEKEIFDKDKERIIIKPSSIIKDDEAEKYFDAFAKIRKFGIKRLRAENISALPYMDLFDLHGGYRLNITNSTAADVLCKEGLKTLCVSPELNLAQIRDLNKPLPTEAVVYGHLPLMTTENCVLKNLDKCPCGGKGEIFDRKGKSFPVIKDGESCRSLILNSVPVFMADKLQDLKNAGLSFGRLMFTIEDAAQTDKICSLYFNGGEFDGEYTRLHFYKGVLNK